MKQFIVGIYEDHYLATPYTEDVRGKTEVVATGELEAHLSGAASPVKAKRPYPKGTRKRRAKVSEPAVEATA